MHTSANGRWETSDFSVYKTDDGGYVFSSDDGYATISIFKFNGKWAWANHFDDDAFYDESSFGFDSAQEAVDSCFDEVYDCLPPRISNVDASASSQAMRRMPLKSICSDRNRMARSRRARANIRCAYSWDLLEDFAKAMGVEGDPDGKAQNTLDALANGRENVQDYVAFLREDGDEFKSKVADELLSEFGKADLAPEPGEQQAEPVIDVDDGSVSDDDGASMPYDVDDDAREARRAAARKAAMRAAKARRAAASKSATKRPQANAKAPAKGNVRVSRRSAVAGVATPRAKEDNTTVDKSAFLFA